MKKNVLISVLLCSSTFAVAQTPEAIAQQVYPKYSEKNQCYQFSVSDNGDYCVKPKQREIRNTADGKLMYWLFTGNHFDFQKNEEDGAHVHSGLAGLLILKEKSPNNWQLLAREPKMMVGAFGVAPETWTFQDFGKDKWGYLTESSDVHQGVEESVYQLIYHVGGQKIGSSVLLSGNDNTGFYGEKCEMYQDSPKERKNCLKNQLIKLKSTLKILRDQPNQQTGFYPIQMTVNGIRGSKKITNQSYLINFNVKKQEYVLPKNSLLAY